MCKISQLITILLFCYVNPITEAFGEVLLFDEALVEVDVCQQICSNKQLNLNDVRRCHLLLDLLIDLTVNLFILMSIIRMRMWYVLNYIKYNVQNILYLSNGFKYSTGAILFYRCFFITILSIL